MMKPLWYVIILCLFLMVFSCKSKEEVNPHIQEYQSITLNFTIYYPKIWEIFETSENVMLSNHVNNFIRPEEERLQEEEDFLARIYVIENDDMIDFITAVSQLKTPHTTFHLDDLKSLFDNVLEGEQAKISQMYQELFLRAPSYHIQFLSINNGMIIGDLKETEDNIKVIYVLRILDEEKIFFAEIYYNTRLPNNDITEFVNIAYSVKIDYNKFILE